MSINLDQVLVKQFENEAIQAFQEPGADLRSTVRVRDAAGAQQVQFQVYGDLVAHERTSVHTPIPTVDPTLTPAIATVKNYTASVMTDIFLNNQVGFDARQEAAAAIGMALKRRMDQIVIDALDAHTFSANVVAAGGDNLNVGHFAKMAEKLGSKVPDMDRHLLCHDSGFYHFIQENDVKTIDSNLRKPLTDGRQPDYMGFDIHKIGDRTEGGLSKTGDNRKNYFWQKSAVGLAVNMEPKIMIDWEPSYGAHRITGVLSGGATVIQDGGVGELTTDEG